MLYQTYQAYADLMGPVRTIAAVSAAMLRPPFTWPGAWPWLAAAAASLDMVARARLTHERPAYGIDRVSIDGRDVAVTEEVTDRTPFGTLLRFRKATSGDEPRVLVVAPMSGHFPTLLRSTVRTMLPEHDVYLTDWHNARDVPLAAGAFGFDDYVAHVIRFLEAMGPGSHVVAVCQPCVAVLAAVAVMAKARQPEQPRSMTLMAGPIDTRVSPTRVNDLATSRPIGWFERHLVATVPLRYRGAMRRVYPGFVQLMAFMSMNPDRHLRAHVDLHRDLATGNHERARTVTRFYDEYFAVTDLPAEFYLETVDRVFQQHLLARGALQWRGERVDPAAIRRTALFTVEGERDDICAVGQTVAAHDLCSSLRPSMRRHHVQTGAGHYGVFNGARWQGEVYPKLRSLIRATS